MNKSTATITAEVLTWQLCPVHRKWIVMRLDDETLVERECPACKNDPSDRKETP